MLANDNHGIIELLPQMNFEQALNDLHGFERIWVLYHFHLNKTWKPYVRPPRTDGRKKISVFATRSPYRPNPIGMSCIELVKIEGLKLHVKNVDILDESPIFDIKPYLPYSDSFPDATTGWIPDEDEPSFYCQFSELAEAQAQFIYSQSGLDLRRFAYVQLSYSPFDKKRKRIEKVAEDSFILACRTWRIHLNFQCDVKTFNIKCIMSAYKLSELEENSTDIYADKDLHRSFNKRYMES